MRKSFEIGGFIAAAVLIVFGIGAIVMGVNARSTVNDTLSQEQIVGTPDMTPTAIKAEAKQAGLNVADLSFPTDVGRRTGDQRRLARPRIRRIHADPRARGDGWPDLRADAALRNRRRQGHERSGPGREGQRPAAGQRRALRCG